MMYIKKTNKYFFLYYPYIENTSGKSPEAWNKPFFLGSWEVNILRLRGVHWTVMNQSPFIFSPSLEISNKELYNESKSG